MEISFQLFSIFFLSPFPFTFCLILWNCVRIPKHFAEVFRHSHAIIRDCLRILQHSLRVVILLRIPCRHYFILTDLLSSACFFRHFCFIYRLLRTSGKRGEIKEAFPLEKTSKILDHSYETSQDSCKRIGIFGLGVSNQTCHDYFPTNNHWYGHHWTKIPRSSAMFVDF